MGSSSLPPIHYYTLRSLKLDNASPNQLWLWTVLPHSEGLCAPARIDRVVLLAFVLGLRPDKGKPGHGEGPHFAVTARPFCAPAGRVEGNLRHDDAFFSAHF